MRKLIGMVLVASGVICAFSFIILTSRTTMAMLVVGVFFGGTMIGIGARLIKRNSGSTPKDVP